MTLLEEFALVWLDDDSDFSEELAGDSSEEDAGVITDELLSEISEELLAWSGKSSYGGITPASMGGSKDELLKLFADEERASSAELLMRSWLRGISMKEELEAFSLELLLLLGSTGPMGAPDSASLTQAVI